MTEIQIDHAAAVPAHFAVYFIRWNPSVIHVLHNEIVSNANVLASRGPREMCLPRVELVRFSASVSALWLPSNIGILLPM